VSIRIGQVLGHYRILRQLGAGGMGEVYEAEDARLGRKVALKLLPEQTARDPRRRERFEREAKAIAALNHPNIVTIYSVEEAEGIVFITMELVEGQTLRQALPRSGLSLDGILKVAVPLADAVAAAHQQGITHRDLKPENILVGRDGKVKVLDFGLAKVEAVFGEAGEGSRLPTRALTEEGRIVGTVAYMSPEQAEGKAVDPRSDVFTLGIILYEMSTGGRPFRGDTAISVMSSILKDNPLPVTQVNTNLPRDVARIVNRCLMKDPARRFQSAQELSAELTELKRQSDSGELEPVAAGARRPGATTTPERGAPRRGTTLAYAAVATVVVILALAGFAMMRGRRGAASRERSATAESGGSAIGGQAAYTQHRIVVLPFENLGAPGDAYFADGVTEEITSRLASASGLGVISRTSAVQYAKTSKTTKQIGAELGVDYVLAGTVRWQRGAAGASRVRVTPQLVRVADDTQLWGDRYDRDMKDIFTVQSEIAQQVVDKLGLAMGQTGGQPAGAQPTQNLDAYQLYLRGKDKVRSSRSDRDAEMQGVDLLEQAVRLDPRFAQGWAALSYGHSHVYHDRYDYNEERLAKARECADKALALQPGLREGHLALGYYYYWGRGDYAQAREEFKAAAGNHEDDAEALQAMAYVMRRQGLWDESVAAMEKAFALNPRDVALVSNLGAAYESLRRYPEALRFADTAIALAPDAPALYLSKIFVQLDVGDTRAARETLKKIDRKVFPERSAVESFLDGLDGNYRGALERLAEYPREALENPSFYRPKSLVAGYIYLAMNDRARAQASCETARQMLDKEIVKNPHDARMHSALGQALACLGRKDEAVREARLGADIVPVSSDALDGPTYLETLAMIYATVGERDAACDLLEKLLAMPSGSSVDMLRLDPIWMPLRGFPRFQKLLERHG